MSTQMLCPTLGWRETGHKLPILGQIGVFWRIPCGQVQRG